tara:strand:- start:14 stop:856 length:843 start_codon:yes stop_codon:yes gene_type:complete
MFKLYDNGYSKLITEKKGVISSDLKLVFMDSTFDPVLTNLTTTTMNANRASPTNFSIGGLGVTSTASPSLTSTGVTVNTGDFNSSIRNIAVVVDSVDGEPYGYLNVDSLTQPEANAGFTVEWFNSIIGTLDFTAKYKALKAGYINFYNSNVNNLDVIDRGRIAIVSYTGAHNQQTVYGIINALDTMQDIYDDTAFTEVTSGHILTNLAISNKKLIADETLIDTGNPITYNGCYIIFYVQKPSTTAAADAIPFAIFTDNSEYISTFTQKININVTGIIDII